ncbi:hypothetical protein C8R45DRAFT_1085126 [Mycena sanguinolenta]|nr:hypothetical protein C8R45DRAFT_1085126 [Mycena sanguinolenta]
MSPPPAKRQRADESDSLYISSHTQSPSALGGTAPIMLNHSESVPRITSEFPATFEEYEAKSGDFQTISYYPGLEFDLLVLADENNLWSVLPSVYYYVVKTNSLGDLFQSIEKDDGTTAALPPIHLRTCVIAREKLLLKQFEPDYTCRRLRETLTWEFCSILAGFVPPDSIARFCKLCAACDKHAMEAMMAGRKNLWQHLPNVFDLPPWDRLKDDL